MRKTVLVVGLVALPTCSVKNDSSAAPAASSGSAVPKQAASEAKNNSKDTALGNVKNYCGFAQLKRGADHVLDNRFDLHVLLDGVFGGKPDQVYVSGHCEYHWGDEARLNTNAYRPNSWECEFESYYASWPPALRSKEFVGNMELESWYGKNPQPIVDVTSRNVLRIDDFNVEGAGRLSVNCEKPPTDKILPASCTVAWYNKFVPAEVHFEGKCATAVMPKPDL